MKFQAAVNVNKIVYSQRRGCSFPSQGSNENFRPKQKQPEQENNKVFLPK